MDICVCVCARDIVSSNHFGFTLYYTESPQIFLIPLSSWHGPWVLSIDCFSFPKIQKTRGTPSPPPKCFGIIGHFPSKGHTFQLVFLPRDMIVLAREGRTKYQQLRRGRGLAWNWVEQTGRMEVGCSCQMR